MLLKQGETKSDSVRTESVALYTMNTKFSFICNALENRMEGFRQAKCHIMNTMKLPAFR